MANESAYDRLSRWLAGSRVNIDDRLCEMGRVDWHHQVVLFYTPMLKGTRQITVRAEDDPDPHGLTWPRRDPIIYLGNNATYEELIEAALNNFASRGIPGL